MIKLRPNSGILKTKMIKIKTETNIWQYYKRMNFKFFLPYTRLRTRLKKITSIFFFLLILY